MVMDHIKHGGKITVGCIPVPRKEASAFGIMAVDNENRIVEFKEKPKDPPAMPGREDMSLGSMGIYVFDADYLYETLQRDSHAEGSKHDFGMDIIPQAVKEKVAYAHDFTLSCIRNRGNKDICYWRDVGTIDAY